MQIGDEDDIKVIKVQRTSFFKENREFNSLASPTTPFQFEAQQQQQQQQQQKFDDASRIQSSIQLQLLNYIRSFQGAAQQQPVEMNHHHLQYSQQILQQQHHHHSNPAEQQHPTIALLQQRFQRLEKDKEMRQAKQLYSNGLEAKFQSSIPCSAAADHCSLQLSLPHAYYSQFSPGTRDQTSSPFEQKNSGRNSARASNHSGEFTEESRSKTKLLHLSLLPVEIDQPTSSSSFKIPSSYPGGDFPSSSSSSSVQKTYNGQSGTQFLLREFMKKESLPTAVDEEIDTTLRL